jgi:protein arginine N-methyltransferase 2
VSGLVCCPSDAREVVLIAEMLHHAMKGATGGDTNMTLRAEDDTSAGDNLAFLKSKLVWDMGQDGKERVLDADGNGVMMGWEEPLSKPQFLLVGSS